MKTRYTLFTLLLLATGCSFTPQENGDLQAGFHPPVVARHWTVNHAVLENGTKVCSISSGYNGVTLFLSSLNGRKEMGARSNRMMHPGATLTVTAGGDNIESYDEHFSQDGARRLVKAFAKGGKAYLEWSEFSGPSGRERTHMQNIVPLDDFGSYLKECGASLGQS